MKDNGNRKKYRESRGLRTGDAAAKRVLSLLLTVLLLLPSCLTLAEDTPDEPVFAEYEVETERSLCDVLFWVIRELLPDEIRIRLCDDALYRRYREDMEFRSELLMQAGVYRSYTQYPGDNVVVIHPVEYYPATRILYAYWVEDPSCLTQREQRTLKKAQSVISSLIRDDMTPLERETAVHDWMCRNITYYGKDESEYNSVRDGDMNERDCCVGALMNGKADCDGYADTFVLLASLAQVGYIGRVEVQTYDGGNHMLNIVYLDDNWYLTDVCWDDGDGNCPTFRTCMNMGEHLAHYQYTWKPGLFDLSLKLNPDFYLVDNYFVHSPLDVYSGAQEAAEQIMQDYRDGYRYIVLKAGGTTPDELFAALDQRQRFCYWSQTKDDIVFFRILYY